MHVGGRDTRPPRHMGQSPMNKRPQSTFQKAERTAAAVALATAATAMVVKLVFAVHLDWYMGSHGITDLSQLSDDYGLAFDSLLLFLGTVLVVFPITVAWAWRLLGRLGFGERRQ